MGELSHYGVKGMKWGVRKDRSTKKGNASKGQLTKADRANIETAKKAKKNPGRVYTFRTAGGKHDIKLNGSEFIEAMLDDHGGTTVKAVRESNARLKKSKKRMSMLFDLN